MWALPHSHDLMGPIPIRPRSILQGRTQQWPSSFRGGRSLCGFKAHVQEKVLRSTQILQLKCRNTSIQVKALILKQYLIKSTEVSSAKFHLIPLASCSKPAPDWHSWITSFSDSLMLLGWILCYMVSLTVQYQWGGDEDGVHPPLLSSFIASVSIHLCNISKRKIQHDTDFKRGFPRCV